MWLLALGVAYAGVALSAHGGAGAPLQPDSGSSAGALVGLFGGYRLDLGPAHVQPEVGLRWNLAAPVVTAPVGAAASFGAPVAFGGYAHVTAPVAFSYGKPGFDAGLLAELTMIPVFRTSLRVGWEMARPEREKCGTCAQPSDHWLTAVVTAGIEL